MGTILAQGGFTMTFPAVDAMVLVAFWGLVIALSVRAARKYGARPRTGWVVVIGLLAAFAAGMAGFSLACRLFGFQETSFPFSQNGGVILAAVLLAVGWGTYELTLWGIRALGWLRPPDAR